jgi:hypothetical protein
MWRALRDGKGSVRINEPKSLAAYKWRMLMDELYFVIVKKMSLTSVYIRTIRQTEVLLLKRKHFLQQGATLQGTSWCG